MLFRFFLVNYILLGFYICLLITKQANEMSKPRVLKDYDKLDKPIILQIKLKYPLGFEKHLITFKGAKKKLISALPFEAEDRYYLIRMTRIESQKIILADKDYDDNGELTSKARAKIEKKLGLKELA